MELLRVHLTQSAFWRCGKNPFLVSSFGSLFDAAAWNDCPLHFRVLAFDDTTAMSTLATGGRAADLTSVALHCQKGSAGSFSHAAVGVDLHVFSCTS